MPSLFSLLYEDPLLPNLSETANGYAYLLLYSLILAGVANIIHAFHNAWHTSGIQRDGTPLGVKHRRQIYTFLILGLIALIVMNVLRLQHLQLGLRTWEDLTDSMHELQGRLARKVRGYRGYAGGGEMPNGLPGRAYKPDVNFESFFPSRATIRKWLENAVGAEEEALNYVREKLPFFERDWHCSRSVWDRFKMLASDASRFWWLQQWLAGYVAWAIFVGMECQKRKIDFSVMVSFIGLSYLAGLAGMQCVFYAFLVLKPIKSGKKGVGVVMPSVFLLLFGKATADIALLPFLWDIGVESGGLDGFDVVQALLAIQPIVAVLLFLWTATKAARIFHLLMGDSFGFAPWIALYSTYMAVTETGKHSWNYFATSLGTRKGLYADEVKHTWQAILGPLGDHHYILALVFDVLLSGLVLCMGSATSSLNVQDMLKASVWPWTRDTNRTRSNGKAIEQAGERYATHEASYAALGSNETGNAVRRRVGTFPGGLSDGPTYHASVGVEASSDGVGQRASRPRGRPSISSTRSRSRSRARVEASPTGQGMRTRSQSRASVSPAKRNASHASTQRGRSRVRKAVEPEESEWVISFFRRLTADGTGAALFTCGVWMIGGLGTASTAVFGTEVVQQ